jgi:DNA polymerase II large subunit
LVYELFKALEIKTGAKNKEIPSFALAATRNNAAMLLNGLFCGDGSVSKSSTLEVNLTSVSRRLIDSTSFLLNRFGIMHSICEEERDIKSELILKFYGKPKQVKVYKIRIYGKAAADYITKIGFSAKKQEKALGLLKWWSSRKKTERTDRIQASFVDRIVSKTKVKSSSEYSYSLTVKPHHTVVVSGVTTFQCDGDEDCVMLLMDALINFSRKYLSENRGGTMDAPLVLSIEINPKEVDDEAYCIEFVSQYPLEFYEAAEKNLPPGDVKIKTVKDVLGSPEQYELPITHSGGTLDVGNIRTTYVELESIPDKIDIQFRLQEKLRPVRLILSHFIPDLYGNLRSYSRQTFRCVSCNTIFRRVPLAGKCNRCGGNLLLTINKGGIEKYLEISREIVDKYALPSYLKQRLELVEREIRSIFEDDKVKQLGLSDFL